MTREHAIEILLNRPGWDTSVATDWIDDFVALGMLKLDEPKTKIDAVHECIISYGSAFDFIKGLERKGFKIVSK
jgi:hypothetical protein